MANLQKKKVEKEQRNTGSSKNLFIETSDLKEKLRNLEDQSRRDNLRFNEINPLMTEASII